MSRTHDAAQELPIAFVGTYGPRRCGIASFTGDLAQAIAGGNPMKRRVSPMVLALTEPSGQYQYPPEVKFEIRQNVSADYPRAAEFVNYSSVRLVSIQHEYGIFGGEDGCHILDFVRALRRPAIVTLHTVLKQPSDNQRMIVRRLSSQCARLIVMSRIAKDLLASSYGVGGERVIIIPHGIPEMARPASNDALKAKFGVAGRRLLLTFGLLSPNKGIETVIRALPDVVRAYPDVVYFVVGATHPTILRREGEAYRTMLEREAEKLGVRDHLVFRGQFVTSDELQEYLLAADVFISPYLNEAQVTSGALSYAMGAGTAVLSTPYWHAKELLSEGRGRLFPFRDHVALKRELLGLFQSAAHLHQAREAASTFARSLTWPRMGNAYYEVIEQVLAAPHAGPHEARSSSKTTRTQQGIEPLRASSLPELSLDHLLRLTDDTGIIQHATYTVAARRTGYCVDDNARALIVAVHADRLNGSSTTRRLVMTYLSYLLASQDGDGRFHNFMSYARVLEDAEPSHDCVGRAVWALGVTSVSADDEGCRRLAQEMLLAALPHTSELGPRGTAQVALGLVSVLVASPERHELREQLDRAIAKLTDLYSAHARDDWRWFEPTLTYDNAILPAALFAAYGVTGERASLRVARESLEFLEENCFESGHLQLIGNSGWHSFGGTKAEHDEQAIDATAFVIAYHSAYTVTKDRHYLRRMREAFAWFLGANRLGLPLYDFATCGCRDGMGLTSINPNQGAESTICFLMALLKTLELAGAGFEHAESVATPD